MKPSAKSLAHRILKGLKKYKSVAFEEMKKSSDQEEILGVYQNDNLSKTSFTTLGLRVEVDIFIPYDEIKEVRVLEPKHIANSISLVLLNEKVVGVEFDGGNGRCRDVWEIVRFLNRIRE